ncbi:LysR family transcriptional regulator [Rhizobium beringeri]|uniref:LysR family transcriptional regulator n=1 Tax=Rhizobium beringeri TaxID=3019934 RepID=UPI003B5AE444
MRAPTIRVATGSHCSWSRCDDLHWSSPRHGSGRKFPVRKYFQIGRSSARQFSMLLIAVIAGMTSELPAGMKYASSQACCTVRQGKLIMMRQANGMMDVRLMRTLLTLLTECSVSKTADILGQAQPTVSLTLKRLREMLDDPLLVRSGGALVPTERGLALKETLRDILGQIDAHLSPHATFDPDNATRNFRIIADNCLGAVFLPQLVGKIAQKAPNVGVDASHMPSYDDLISQLADGSIDAVIGNWPHPPEYLRMSPLLTTDIVCVVRPNHRLASQREPISMGEFLKEKHLSPTSDKRAHLSPIDGRLIELGLKRNIAVSVPEYAITPYVLTQSDLVFTTGRIFAEQIAQAFPLVVLEAPRELGHMQFYMLWHECKHQSPDHVWLRQMIKSVAAGVRVCDPTESVPITFLRAGAPVFV